MKKNIVFILATFILLFTFAGCRNDSAGIASKIPADRTFKLEKIDDKFNAEPSKSAEGEEQTPKTEVDITSGSSSETAIKIDVKGEPLPPDASETPSLTTGGETAASVKTVTISIRCDNAVKNWDKLKPVLQNVKFVPKNGVILDITTVEITDGATVFDVLAKICRQKRIHMEHVGNKVYNSEYIRGINNLYEFDAGELSGWTYMVNNWVPNYGCSRYVLEDGDEIVWHYTCDLGRDLE